MEKVLTIFMTKNLAHSALILTKNLRKETIKFTFSWSLKSTTPALLLTWNSILHNLAAGLQKLGREMRNCGKYFSEYFWSNHNCHKDCTLEIALQNSTFYSCKKREILNRRQFDVTNDIGRAKFCYNFYSKAIKRHST